MDDFHIQGEGLKKYIMKPGYHVEYGRAAILFLIIVNVYLYLRDTKEDLSFTEFRKFAFWTLLVNLFNTLSVITFPRPNIINPVINAMFNCAYFISMTCLSMRLVGYILAFINEKQKIEYRIPLKRTLCFISFMLAGLYLLMVFFSGFDYNLIYQWKNMFFVVFPLPYYFTANSLFLLIRYRSCFQKMHLFTLFTSVLFCILGKLIETFILPDYTLLSYCLGVSVPSLLFTMETPDYKKLQMSFEELKSAREQAQLANRTKSSFLANMSHEIRSPIHAIIGMSEMVVEEYKKEGEDDVIREYGTDIRNASNELLCLINSILDYSKIHSGKTEILPERYDLNKFLSDIRKECETIFKGEAVNLHFDVKEDIRNDLYGDSLKIRRILISFVNISIKYTKEGEVRIEISSEETDGGNMILILTVKDTGIGIDEDNMKKLLYFIEEEAQKEGSNYSYTDLEIFVSKTLTEMMGGELSIESAPGKGTVVQIRIPQKYFGKERVGSITYNHDRNSGKKSDCRKISRILLVDDTSVNLKIMESILEGMGFAVDISESGRECLNKAQETEYDLILMDYLMPEMNGIETLGLLRKQETSKNKDTPAIMLSAGSEDEIDYKKEGFSAFITKPVNKEKLKEILMGFMN